MSDYQDDPFDRTVTGVATGLVIFLAWVAAAVALAWLIDMFR